MALERYARVFDAVEINSSFYRPHARTTYRKWAAMTPRSFRFAVKVPRALTHEQRLRRARPGLARFLDEVSGLGARLGPLLVQLPPSLEFAPRVAGTFFATLRELHDGDVVCEPRHASWFHTRADSLLERQRVGRVAADPSGYASAGAPAGWPGIVYYRLHGSPRRYWSVYAADRLEAWATQLRELPRDVAGWCVFDNTAGGGAIANALSVLGQVRLRRQTGRSRPRVS
jgi:uncharacterized protein YecE (DUF72 family)